MRNFFELFKSPEDENLREMQGLFNALKKHLQNIEDALKNAEGLFTKQKKEFTDDSSEKIPLNPENPAFHEKLNYENSNFIESQILSTPKTLEEGEKSTKKVTALRLGLREFFNTLLKYSKENKAQSARIYSILQELRKVYMISEEEKILELLQNTVNQIQELINKSAKSK